LDDFMYVVLLPGKGMGRLLETYFEMALSSPSTRLGSLLSARRSGRCFIITGSVLQQKVMQVGTSRARNLGKIAWLLKNSLWSLFG
jgi:hypothetical protein